MLTVGAVDLTLRFFLKKRQYIASFRSITDICTLPVDSGDCLAYVPSWYYDASTRTCQKFVYGGCEGNDNRFDTEEECLNRCQTDVTGVGTYMYDVILSY